MLWYGLILWYGLVNGMALFCDMALFLGMVPGVLSSLACLDIFFQSWYFCVVAVCVLCLFLTVPCVGLQSVIVLFSDHIHFFGLEFIIIYDWNRFWLDPKYLKECCIQSRQTDKAK